MTKPLTYHSREWFEECFFAFAKQYDLTDGADRINFWRHVERSIECLGTKGIRETFNVEGRTYSELGQAVAQNFIGDNLDELAKRGGYKAVR